MWRVQTQNDHQAFAVLVERWEEPIFNLCARMTGDPHQAEDLMQDAFMRLYQKRRTYRPVAKFSTYLWRLAINVCYDDLRRRSRRAEAVLDDTPFESGESHLQPTAPDASPGTLAAEKEESECVRCALLELGAIYRGVIILRHYEDLKCKEIAEVLDIPVGTVYSRLAEGYERLTRILEPKLQVREMPTAEPTVLSQPKQQPSIL